MYDRLSIPGFWKLGVRKSCVLGFTNNKLLKKVGVETSIGECYRNRAFGPVFRSEIAFGLSGIVEDIILSFEGFPPDSMKSFLKELLDYLNALELERGEECSK